MSEPDTQRQFLRDAGWPVSGQRMTGDASNRHYLRLTRPDGTTAVLMNAGMSPDAVAQTAAFVAVGGWLRAQGYSAPAILKADTAQGLLLLEDLGPDVFPEVLARDPGMETTLYAAATRFLHDLHRNRPPAGAFPQQDATYFTSQARLLTDHYLTAAPKAETARLVTLLQQGFDRLSRACTVLVLRDFHAGNLVWLSDRAGSAAVGLLDYQDALIGHPAYDLASLLQDSRRRITPDLEQAMLETYWSGAVPDWFRHDYALMGAQRLMRVLGIFARLGDQGKPQYRQFIPETLHLLWRNLDSGYLPELRDWARQNLGEATR